MAMFRRRSVLACCCYSPLPRRFCTPQLQRGTSSPSPFLHGSALAMRAASMLSRDRAALPQDIMSVERDFHMATGDGANSYAANSIFQRKTVTETWPELHKAVREALKSLSPSTGSTTTTMVAADLGCSSGPNTLLVVSEVMSTIRTYVQETRADDDHSRAVREVQFFLNDLAGNDFNLLFRSLYQQRLRGLAAVEEKAAVPCYIAGLPGSFYTRIFPCQSVHLFHSSQCLIWRSKIPEDLSNGTHVNADNIYIGKTTPKVVVDLFREQFKNDFELFLSLRHKELVSGGCMLLSFVGRKREEMPMQGNVARVWEVLSEALQYLVDKGRVEKKKLSSFNMPYYAPSLDEVTELIKNNDLFDIEDMRLFESNWDAYDDSDGHAVLNCSSSAENIAKLIRAAIEPLIMKHFGQDIIEELFMVYSSILAKNLEKGKAMCPVIVIMLKKSKL